MFRWPILNVESIQLCSNCEQTITLADTTGSKKIISSYWKKPKKKKKKGKKEKKRKALLLLILETFNFTMRESAELQLCPTELPNKQTFQKESSMER